MKEGNKMKKFHCILMLIGGFGAVILTILAIANSKASDLVSMIPLTIICCSMFIAGYVCYFKEK